MAIEFRRFLKGILLKGNTADPSDNLNGSLFYNSTSNRLKGYLESAVRTIVSEDQTQTLTNKTIDADLNTVSNIEDSNIKASAGIDATKLADGSVSNTEFQYINSLTSNAQDQIDAAATAASNAQTDIDNHIASLTDAHDASAISVVPTGNLNSDNVQAGLEELQADLDTLDSDITNHINETVGAHPASAISVIPTGNLTSTEVQAALEELQSDIDGVNAANRTLSNLTSPTSINQALLPGSSLIEIGNVTNNFAGMYADIFGVGALGTNGIVEIYGTSGATLGVISTNVITPQGITVDASFAVGSGTRSIALHTINHATANSQATGPVYIETGNKTAGTGNSGGIFLTTGSSVGGLRGAVEISARLLRLPNQSSDPSGASNGAIYYNTTSGVFRYYNGSIWQDVGGASYTDEQAQDAVGTILDNGTVGDITFTYDDVTPLISATIDNDSILSAKIAAAPILRNTVRRAATLASAESIEEEYFHNITILGSQTNTVISSFTELASEYDCFEITYRYKETTTNRVRLGTIRVVTDGTNVAITDNFTETNTTNLTFSAVINGLNLEIRYSSGNGGTLRADVKRFINSL